MLLQDIIEYLLPIVKVVGEFLVSLFFFIIVIFGLNIFAAVAAAF